MSSEELKKEWESSFDKICNKSHEKNYPFDCWEAFDGYNDDIKSFISSLLAKQQAEFDTILNSGRKMYELGKKEAQEEFVKKVEELKLTD